VDHFGCPDLVYLHMLGRSAAWPGRVEEHAPRNGRAVLPNVVRLPRFFKEIQ
jgi:hypothetical protein